MTRSRMFIASISMMLSSACVMAADAIYKVGEINADATQSHSNRNQTFGGAGGTTVHYGAYFLELNGIGYFVARDGIGHDHDTLWRTDGTPAGTTVVRSLPNQFTNTSTTVRAAVKSGNLLYYLVGGISGPTSIMRSDGTAAGTYRLADDVLEMADVNGTLYFSTGVGKALFKTLGNQDSTVNIKNFAGGSATYLTNASGTLFFSGDDGTNGRELWKSNGTDANTVMIRNIAQNAGASSNPARITASGGKAYFVTGGVAGTQLWVSDGTEAGTLLLINFADASNPSPSVKHLTDLNGTLFAFVGGALYANLKIYKSTGTAGTTVIADPGPFGLGLPTSTGEVTVVGDTLYFLAGDRAGSSASFLYKTSGGVAAQASNQYINGPSPTGTGARAAAPLLSIGNTVYFANAPDNSVNLEVVALTHNVSGSERNVADISPGINIDERPYDFAAFNSKLFFTQDNRSTGISPYLTDGTTTTMLKDINSTTLGSVLDRGNIAVGGGKFFFATADQKLFFSTGTGMTLIGQPPAFAYHGPIAGFNAGAIFVGFSSQGSGLHFTDGSTPVLIKAATPSAISNLHPVGSTLYFTLNAGAPDYNKELWKTDGTVAGTIKVKTFLFSGLVRQIVRSNGVTFMAVDDGVTGLELWRTDGTEAGTVLVKDIQPGSSLQTSQYGGYAYLFPYSGGVYFMVVGTSATNGIGSFYKSDGTAAGTVAFLTETNGLPFGGTMLGVSNNLLYYSNGKINVYNGTASSEILDKNATYEGFVDVGGNAFFSASADLYKTGLYKSDGTAAGTVVLLADAPSTYSYTSFAGQLYLLFFTANEGKELWRSNGTAAGTFMVQDLLKGPGDGVLDILRSANGALFLNARTSANNPELFAILATSSAGDRPTVTAQTVFGTVGVPLSVPVQSTGANVTLSSNEYPGFQFGFLPGMAFNPATGIISGTPVEKGTFRFDIGAQTEAGFASAKIEFQIGDGKVALDIDGNGVADAQSDGLLALRYMFGLTGQDLTRGAVAANAARSTPAEIIQYLDSIKAQHMDVDLNGSVDAMSDGLLIIRYLSGVRGEALIAGAIGAGAARTSAAQIQAYLQTIVP